MIIKTKAYKKGNKPAIIFKGNTAEYIRKRFSRNKLIDWLKKKKTTTINIQIGDLGPKPRRCLQGRLNK